MPWNKPGNHSDDPWGNKKQSSPPDLDKLLNEWIRKVKSIFVSKHSVSLKSSPDHKMSASIAIVLLIALVLWVASGFFIVNPAEEAVILRFGKYADVYSPGLHWMARGIDTKYLVDIQKIYSFSLQGDFLTKSSEQNDLPRNNSLSSPDQSKNLVNVELNVQYRISDPRAYLFTILDPDDTIQQVASGALSDVIGTMKLDEVLTTGREMVSSGVLDRIKQVLATYHAGLEVVAVTLKKVQSPDQVREAFNDVNRADQDKATYIQQAQAYASKVIPLAQGEAARILADARAYQQQVILSAGAQVAKYQALFNAYRISPQVTRERMYLETMQTVLGNTSKVLVDTGNNNNLLYLPLDQLLKHDKSRIPSAASLSGGKNNEN